MAIWMARLPWRVLGALRPVAGVDLHVLLGQIAAPEARLARPAAVEDEADQTLLRVHHPLQVALGELRRHAVAAYQHALQVDAGLARVEGHARVARGRKNAS